MTGKYHAYIIDDDGDLKVRPSFASVDMSGPRDEDGSIGFVIRNLTSYVAIVTFRARRPFGPRSRSVGKGSFVIKGRSVGRIPLSHRANGLYFYEVMLRRAGRRSLAVKARGESDPGLIADP